MILILIYYRMRYNDGQRGEKNKRERERGREGEGREKSKNYFDNNNNNNMVTMITWSFFKEEE